MSEAKLVVFVRCPAKKSLFFHRKSPLLVHVVLLQGAAKLIFKAVYVVCVCTIIHVNRSLFTQDLKLGTLTPPKIYLPF
jgi:hypothetical protein